MTITGYGKHGKGLMKVTAAVFAVLLTAVFAAGSNGARADEEKALGFTETVSDVVFTLSTDKTEYDSGETINYTLTVTNNRLRYYTSKAQFTYDNTEGLYSATGEALPNIIAKLESGESVTVTGALTGDPALFPPVEKPTEAAKPGGNDAGKSNLPVIILCAAGGLAAVCAIVFLILRAKKGKGGKAGKAMAVLLALAVGAGIVPAGSGPNGVTCVSAADYDTVVSRPYVKVMYAGQEVMVRMIIELHQYPKRITIPSAQKDIPKAITCHDPSIFKDFDGTYYIFGTHITGGYTTDLRNWTSIDGQFRNTFTEETKAKIREWNKDSGDWYGYLWAPDVIYNPVLKKYCYYLSANGDDWKSNIVMLTSDKVTGPYEYAGSVVYGGFTAEDAGETDVLYALGTDTLPDRYIKNGVKNRQWGNKWPNCIDPCVFYDDDGKLWMSYGSWSGGIFLLELDENTGLRDYTVKYDTDNHSDAYFGKKIAGGMYVSGEGSYIEKIGDYYWLFMSYGGLEAKGGYNVRVFRSKTVDGDYRDLLGNSSIYDTRVTNHNQSVGVRLFGGYKWRTFNQGQVAQGHNSAFVDDDGRAYMIYHTRTTDGSEGHTVKVHQLFTNAEGWLVAAPYITAGEKLSDNGVKTEDLVGSYDVIIHELAINYAKLEAKTPKYINLNADGTITGDFDGTWSITPGTSYIYLSFNNDNYSGVALKMNVENTKIETPVFTVVGERTQVTVWGRRSIE